MEKEGALWLTSGKELALWHLFSLYVEGPLWPPSAALYRCVRWGSQLSSTSRQGVDLLEADLEGGRPSLTLAWTVTCPSNTRVRLWVLMPAPKKSDG